MLTKAQIKRRIKKVIAIFFRIGLKNRNFSILSNNCWGGVIYDKYALPYSSPTIGLWIPPNDYIKFLKNIDFYKKQKMEQISYEESHVANLLIKRSRERKYDFKLEELIIGRLHDIDIIFLHYTNFFIEKAKWEKRIQRINFNNLLVKMNDQNGCTYEDFNNFLSLDYPNKIFFTSNKTWKNHKDVLYVKKYEKYGYVLSDIKRGDVSLNITQLLNSLLIK